MNAKLKAESLVESYLDITPVDYSLDDSAEDVNRKSLADFKLAKQCALIAVDEIISVINAEIPSERYKNYWEEVKTEIEKL